MTIKEVSEKYNISQDTLRYYERVGMIPQVHRTGGNRDYQEDDLGGVDLAFCMRSAGLRVVVMIEYVRLYMQGDSTIPARLQLLLNQKAALEAQMADTQRMLDKLEYKISRYQVAVKTGKLTWD